MLFTPALSLAPVLLAAAAAPAPTEDPDLRCVAAISAILGVVAEKGDADAETTTGLTGVFMYFLGRVDARRPGLDYAASLRAVMNEPGYERRLQIDLKRCGAEAEERGKMLKSLGEELQATVPLGDSRPG